MDLVLEHYALLQLSEIFAYWQELHAAFGLYYGNNKNLRDFQELSVDLGLGLSRIEYSQLS